MQDDEARFKLPGVMRTDGGELRSVGFELEFSGIGFDEAVEVLRSCLGATISSRTAAQTVLRTNALGDFNVEVDWDYLKRKAEQEEESTSGAGWVEELARTAALVVPIEVACPPIAITELEKLSPVVVALREAGAVGTEESLVAAYGVHINAEIPKLDEATLYFYLAAFSLLQWWLVKAHKVNATRRISHYVRLYSQDYVKQLLARPDARLDELLEGYLEHNASRNRALDMLPMLAEIDEERVKRAVNDPKIKPRPAFHYRMPNCQIEQQGWSLARSWNIWWVVEELANRPRDLEDLTAAFFAADRPLTGVSRHGWTEFVDQWLKDRELA